MKKEIILCADDFAQNEAISQGIVQLAQKKRLNAISCLVTSPHWAAHARWLDDSGCFVGLHLNLTWGKALTVAWQNTYGDFPSLSGLILQTYARRLDSSILEDEIMAQVDAFTDARQHAPDFIDGHQHIHQLPQIREALLRVYQRQQLRCFWRQTTHDWHDILTLQQVPKRQLISLLGGFRLKNMLQQHRIPHNRHFSGIYHFKQAPDYARQFERFLQHIADRSLMMCHPGLKSHDLDDPLAFYRYHEWNYLKSDDFLQHLQDNQCIFLQDLTRLNL